MYKSMIWVLVEKGLYTLFQFITLIVLGRLLSVEDYGVYGTMIVLISVSEILIDSGFGGAIIQKKEVNQADVNTLFTVNLLISIALYLLIFVSAPFIESIYDISGLTLYIRITGLVIIFFALSVVQNSLLIRNMKFKKSAIINLTACCISSIIAILMAYHNAGVWALIIQTVLNSMLMTTFLWVTNWAKINFQIDKKSLIQMWGFGSKLLFSNILTTIASNISANIIPKIGTLKQSGLYVQASKLSSIPSNILSLSVDKSTFPILSRESTPNDLINKARYLNRSFMTLFTPFFPLLSLYSFTAILLVLGSKWTEAVPYFEILSWSGLAILLQSLYRNIMKSSGDSKTILKVEIIKTILTLITIGLSLKFGILFLVYGITISYFMGAALWMIVLHKKADYNIKSNIKDIIKPICSSTCLFAAFKLTGIDFTSLTSLMYLPIYMLLYILLGILLKDATIMNVIRKTIKA